MKKILLSLATLLVVSALSAQESESATVGFKKGDAFVTGNVGFNSRKNDVNKGNSFTIMPTLGYFATDNIALGVALTYMGQTLKSTGAPEVKNNSYGAGLFGRYYFTPANTFSFFGELAADYNHSTSKVSGGDKQTGNGFGIQAGPGINYFISPRFSLQSYIGLISYGSTKNKAPYGDNKTSEFEAGLNFAQVRFGLLYKL
nr:outer membrane beta-barrel protein [uncultured Flavobacterium sp.]